jgi:hypothetical protein
MVAWRPGVVALVALLAVSPCAAAQDQTPAGTSSDSPGEQPVAGAAAGLAAAELPADQPFKRLFPNLWHDLKSFPSVDTGIVLAIGGALSGIAAKNDEYLTQHASAGGAHVLYTTGGGLGAGYTQVSIALGTYAVGRLAGHEKTAHIGADLIRAQLLTGVITHSLKLITQRERPTGEQESSTDTYSFPSAHSSVTWTTATVLWRHLGWKVGIPASALSGFVSASRLQQNAHYMSDVIFGAAIGIASARTVTFGHGERQVIVAPTPVPGGAAVTFTLQPR